MYQIWVQWHSAKHSLARSAARSKWFPLSKPAVCPTALLSNVSAIINAAPAPPDCSTIPRCTGFGRRENCTLWQQSDFMILKDELELSVTREKLIEL
jgi:hypothetical protein